MRVRADERLGALLLTLGLTGAAVAIGAVHTPVLLLVSACVLLSAVLVLLRVSARGVRSLPAITFSVLAGYTLLQSIPFPLGALAWISPATQEVWARSRDAFGLPAPTWASLSLDPGATSVEALRWLTYGAAAATAASLSARRGLTFLAASLLASATVVSLATVAHGLLGATRVFGVYEPTFTPAPWHVGPLLNPNNLAGYLNVGICCGLGLVRARRPPAPRWLLGLAVATVMAVALTTASRAGLGALASAILLFILLDQRVARGATAPARRVRLIAAGALLGGAALGVLAFHGDASRELFDRDLKKVEMLGEFWPMVVDHLWLGTGRGAFESAFPAYRTTSGHIVFTHAESFPVHWAAEWGVPVATAALAAVAWMLSPRRLAVTRSSLAAGAWVGALALLAQNLFDLALEVPGVMLALSALLGALWGARSASGTRPEPGALRTPRRSGAIAVVVALLLLGHAAIRGWHDLASDRESLHRVVTSTRFEDPASVAELRERLRAAIDRHPAEPYFPLLGATAAWRAGDQNPVGWIQRALDRERINGRVHLLLAEVLASRAAKRQALFELRLAIEGDPALIAPAVRLALRWSSDLDELLTLAPAGPLGAATLDGLSSMLPTGARRSLGRALDRETLTRDPRRTGPHERLAADVLRGAAECTEPPACHEELERHARALDELAPTTSAAARLRAEWHLAAGRPEEAERLLRERCPAVSDRIECQMLRARCAAALPSAARLEVASRELLAVACSAPRDCARASEFLGELRVQRDEWGTSLAHFRRAAAEEPTDGRLLRLAEAAVRASAYTDALRALGEIESRRGGVDPERARRIEEIKRRLTAEHLDPR